MFAQSFYDAPIKIRSFMTVWKKWSLNISTKCVLSSQSANHQSHQRNTFFRLRFPQIDYDWTKSSQMHRKIMDELQHTSRQMQLMFLHTTMAIKRSIAILFVESRRLCRHIVIVHILFFPFTIGKYKRIFVDFLLDFASQWKRKYYCVT